MPLAQGSKFSANAETQLVSYNSTLKELAAFLSNILSATYAELYGDVDGQELTVTPSQVTPLKDSIAIFQSGLATREALAPRVLTAIGLTQSEIEAEARTHRSQLQDMETQREALAQQLSAVEGQLARARNGSRGGFEAEAAERGAEGCLPPGLCGGSVGRRWGWEWPDARGPAQRLATGCGTDSWKPPPRPRARSFPLTLMSSPASICTW